ncbi:MAG: cytochrome b/b6 domain-containing protein [Ectothiorhodospira sp.]
MNATTERQVWDPLVRVFHWGLAAAFAVAWFTGHQPHVLAGYAALILVTVRIVWGFAGPRHARFRDFVRPPGEVMAHLREMLRGRMKREPGHNPLAGWVYLLLFLGLLGVTVSGLVVLGGDKSAGPLAGMLAGMGHGTAEAWEGVHEFFANFTLALVLLHLAGVFLASLMQRQNLAAAMVTGRKQVDEPALIERDT